MLEKKWKTLYNKPIEDVRTAFLDNMAPGKQVYIGTDSQTYDGRMDFVTAIIIRTPGKGGIAFYTKQKDYTFRSLRKKLLDEAWLTLETAMEVEPLLPKDCYFEIHLDANSDTKFKSSEHVKELVGMIVGQGFRNVVTKPNAWAASHVAEHVVKHKNVTAD